MFTLPRFYPILDTDALARHELDAVTAAQQILDAGARILQFRHKGFYSRDVLVRMEQISALCFKAKVPFVVNDRADLAAIFGAGLHLGQEDLPPAQARKVTGANCVIGYSTHNENQLREAFEEPVNYLALGPMFATGSKQNPDPIVGLTELRRLRPLSQLPLVAIGGITLTNAREVLEAGADSVAVIGDLYSTGDLAARALNLRTRQWLQAVG